MDIVEGTGTFNGISGYTFLVEGIDKQDNNGDMICVEIIDPNGNVVFDTQPGAPANAAPDVSITGGSVNVKE